MKFDKSKLALFITLVLSAGQCLAAPDKKLSPTPHSQKRTLHFPDTSLGFIRVTPRDKGSENNSPCVAAARGKVVVDVPPGHIVALDLKGRVFQNLALLDLIKDQPIECVRASFVSMDDSEMATTDKALAHICQMRKLEEINVDRSDATDAGLKLIRNMPELRIISIFMCESTGASLKEFATCPNLRQLHLWSSGLHEGNLQYLSGLKRLEFLNVSATRLTNSGLKLISRCINLRTLRAFDNPIDDGCIDDIRKLKYLDYLDLAGTKVTLSGIKRLQGLPLKRLVLPASVGAVHDRELSRLFPGSVFQHHAPKKVTQDDMVIFAPTH